MAPSRNLFESKFAKHEVTIVSRLPAAVRVGLNPFIDGHLTYREQAPDKMSITPRSPARLPSRRHHLRHGRQEPNSPTPCGRAKSSQTGSRAVQTRQLASQAPARSAQLSRSHRDVRGFGNESPSHQALTRGSAFPTKFRFARRSNPASDPGRCCNRQLARLLLPRF